VHATLEEPAADDSSRFDEHWNERINVKLNVAGEGHWGYPHRTTPNQRCEVTMESRVCCVDSRHDRHGADDDGRHDPEFDTLYDHCVCGGDTAMTKPIAATPTQPWELGDHDPDEAPTKACLFRVLDEGCMQACIQGMAASSSVLWRVADVFSMAIVGNNPRSRQWSYEGDKEEASTSLDTQQQQLKQPISSHEVI
jgi:hypothetical protein